MTRLDRFVALRMGSRILAVVVVFFGLIVLAEALDTPRFDRLVEISGQQVAIMAIFTAAAKWAIKSLTVTVLIGAIIALLEFQASREFVVMKASGLSIWRILRGPVVMIALAGALVAFVVEGVTTEVNRAINPTPPGLGGGIVQATATIWFEQQGADGRYYMTARDSREDGTLLSEAIAFPLDDPEIRRIEAEEARFVDGHWHFDAPMVIDRAGDATEPGSFRLASDSTPSDLRMRLGSTEDFTFLELAEALRAGLTDPETRAAAATRYAKLTALPALLVGALLIAFAFTAGYRRTNAYGATIVYGIVLGFVVFVVTEMADRAGSSGVLDPAFAAWGPAAVAILIGVTVLLYKEDGRA